MKRSEAKKPKEETMWAIHGEVGFYTGTGLTRRDAKEMHMSSLGYTDWKQCAAKGDRAIKVRIVPVECPLKHE